MNTQTHRPLSQIAAEIVEDYGKRGKPVYFAAAPYVEAMAQLDQITDPYYDEPGGAKSVVLYGLHNLSYWRGETAKRIKAELKALL